ncbi:hypothetical protein [Novosphingobium fuchskuhlense]|uniref:hypothetical protein n=1 Tax=Novosphingobium fuchskuhlense TaxID=1117702 RepID=UPI0012E3B071|nr:hypothetical protein [Novosphingobium fuchskuhlense]
MITWLFLATLVGAMFTCTYATVAYALMTLTRGAAGIAATGSTFATFSAISYMILSSSKQIDAGGMLMHLLFILVASLLGGPIGSLLFVSAVNKIERRKSATFES